MSRNHRLRTLAGPEALYPACPAPWMTQGAPALQPALSFPIRFLNDITCCPILRFINPQIPLIRLTGQFGCFTVPRGEGKALPVAGYPSLRERPSRAAGKGRRAMGTRRVGGRPLLVVVAALALVSAADRQRGQGPAAASGRRHATCRGRRRHSLRS
jgi:hypothetical protein